MNTVDLVFTKKNLHFKKGDVIFNERDEGKEMYLIDSGEIQIVKTTGDAEKFIAGLSSGNFFGDMALITGNRRSASAIAFTNCNLHAMDKETFFSNIANNRDFMEIVLLKFAQRLEEADNSLAILFKIVSKSSTP